MPAVGVGRQAGQSFESVPEPRMPAGSKAPFPQCRGTKRQVGMQEAAGEKAHGSHGRMPGKSAKCTGASAKAEPAAQAAASV